jgi:MED7 protein
LASLRADHRFDRKRRDELSHNTFLMLQECNKFREHQAREVLIELLEKQLVGRSKALSVLKEEVQKANDVLGMMET